MSAPKIKPGPFATKEPFVRPRQYTFTSQMNGTQQGSVGSNIPNEGNGTISNINSNNKPYGVREKGLIEKTLASYGFVQCTERKGRFFFHYSEYKGNLSNLKVGDVVEFQESVDKRTGKPVAILIVKLNEMSSDTLGGKQVEGTVLSEAKFSVDCSLPPSEMGRVTYEQGGETFFLPFGNEDVEMGQKICVGEKVTFMIASDSGTGTVKAQRLRRKSSPGDQYQGVVCSMKDNYGFIERADVVKEIFFHFSEYEGDIEDLALGDDVEYGIQVRNNKDVAVNIHKIPAGTVVFEDIAKEVKRGKIKKTLKMSVIKKLNDALVGRIVYETLTGPIEIMFGEKDPLGDYTIFAGDIVEFCIATDRRDKVQHATNIRLVDDTFSISKEKREKGFITTLKEGFGFIRCTDREARMFFHFSELLCSEHKLNLQDEVEFTVIQDPTNAARQIAVRIKVLPQGTIVVQLTHSLERYVGVVQKETGNLRSTQAGSKDSDPGILMYEVEGTKQMIPYSSSVVDGNLPKLEEKVEFQISECQKNKTKVAINVKVLGRAPGRTKERGFVVTLKELFGFIETTDHEREIYFHFSNFEGDVEMLEVGNEVEYQICNKAGRVSAECIRRIPSRSIPVGEVCPTILEGRVLRGLHAADSAEYFGLIQLTSDVDPEIPPTPTSATPSTPSGTPTASAAFPFSLESGTVYPFSIMSLVDKRETLLVRGDLVRFLLVEVPVGTPSSGNGKGELSRSDSTSGVLVKKKWAFRVAPFRKFIHARIESINEMGGVLSYEADLGLKMTFSSKDTQESSELSVGDEVEFVVLSHNGIKMAVNLQKATDRPRPERLLSRIKSVTDDQCPRAVTVRQPKGPDGTKGFKCPRQKPFSPNHNGPTDASRVDGSPAAKTESSKVVDRAGGDVLNENHTIQIPKNDMNEVFENAHYAHPQEGSTL